MGLRFRRSAKLDQCLRHVCCSRLWVSESHLFVTKIASILVYVLNFTSRAGGSLPVDGALLLEFLPYASQNLLTLLSVFWPVGQLVASLVAWIFIPNFSCDPNGTSCTKEQNMG